MGYRKITELLRSTADWAVHDKRVEHIRRREGFKDPEKLPKKSGAGQLMAHASG